MEKATESYTDLIQVAPDRPLEERRRRFEDKDLSRSPVKSVIAHGQLWEDKARLGDVDIMKKASHPDKQVPWPAGDQVSLHCVTSAYERYLTPSEACICARITLTTFTSIRSLVQGQLAMSCLS